MKGTLEILIEVFIQGIKVIGRLILSKTQTETLAAKNLNGSIFSSSRKKRM